MIRIMTSIVPSDMVRSPKPRGRPPQRSRGPGSKHIPGRESLVDPPKLTPSFRGDAKHRTMVRNCAPENLEVPGSLVSLAPRNDGILLRHHAKRGVGSGDHGVVGLDQTLRETDGAAGLDDVGLDR